MLCLPAGYLILTMYSFANLDDRSWGTRAEQTASNGDSTNVLYSFLYGCGLWKGETLLHFLGRTITCRCQTVQEKDVENAHPYAAMADDADETSFDNHIWQLSADASKAICKPVDELLQFIAEYASAESDDVRQRQTQNLTTLTASALAACPSLMSRGQWTRCWDKESGVFKIPRGAPEVSDKRFWEQMQGEIAAHMDQTYTWADTPAQQAGGGLPEGHAKIGTWLTDVGVNEHLMTSKFLESGYDDTTFLVGIDERVLQSIGIPSTLTGRAHIKKMLDAIERLPRNVLQESIPPTVQEWLDALCLPQYAAHFIRCGYSNTDLPLFEGLALRDLRQMGIAKPAHQDKLMKAIGKLNKLLEQGRSPEGKSMADIEEGETREMVLRLKEVPLENTFLSKRMVLLEEESFWTQMVAAVLNPRLDSISNVSGLKGKLRNLRNIGVTVLFLLNASWMAMMLELTGANTVSIHLLHTNPLGLLFLFVYGSIFVIQFVAMVSHRWATMVEYFAAVPFPAKDGVGPKHRYAEIIPE